MSQDRGSLNALLKQGDRGGMSAWLAPSGPTERAAIFAKLADAGLLETEAHQRFRDQQPRDGSFFGLDRSADVGRFLPIPIVFDPV